MATKGTVGNLLVQLSLEMGQLRAQVREVDDTFKTSFNSIKKAAREVGAAIGVGLGVNAVVQFGKSVIETAHQLEELGRMTGISATTLSGMKTTLEMNGVSVEDFANAVFMLSKNLGNIKKDTDPAAQAISRLGLNLGDLRKLGTEELLDTLIKALARIPSEWDRNAIAAELFGRQARGVVQAIDALAKSDWGVLKRSGWTDEEIRQLAEAREEWTLLYNVLVKFSGALLADFIRDVKQFFNYTIPNLQLLKSLGGQGAALGGVGGAAGGPAFVPKLPGPAKGGAFGAAPDLEAAKKAAEELQKLLEESYRPLFKEIDDEQEKSVKAGQEILKILQEINTAGLIPQEQEVAKINQLYDDMRLKLIQAFEAVKQAVPQNLLQELERQRQQGISKARSPYEQLASELESTLTKMAEGDETVINRTAEVVRVMDELNAAFINIERQAEVFGASVDPLALKIEILKQKMQALLAIPGPEAAAQVEQYKQQLQQLTQDQALLQGIERIGQAIGNSFQGMLQGVLQGTQTFGDAMKNMLRNIMASISNEIMQEMTKIVTQLLKQMVAQMMGIQAGGAGGGGLNLASLLFGGGKSGGMSGPGWTFSMGGAFPSPPMLGGGGAGFMSNPFGFLMGGMKKAEKGGIFPGHFIPIRAFQSGGFVSRPTLGLIGEGGPEAIIPLNKGLPIVVNIVNDYSGAVDPRGFKTSEREVKQYVIKDIRAGGDIRHAIKEHAK